MTPQWMRMIYGVALCAVLVGWGGLLAKQRAQAHNTKHSEVGPAKENAMAPAVHFRTPKGEEVTLKAYQGKWILLNFWATWCEPCRREMPSMEQLANQFQKQKRNFVMLAASVDVNWRIIRNFFQEHPFFKGRTMRMRILRDPNTATSLRYGTSVFPETYLIDPRGKVRWKVIGPRKWDDPKTIKKLLALMQTKP